MNTLREYETKLPWPSSRSFAASDQSVEKEGMPSEPNKRLSSCQKFGGPAAAGVIAVKWLARTESNLTIIMYMGLVATPILFACALFAWRTPTPSELVVLVLRELLFDGKETEFTPSFRVYTRLMW